MGLASTDVGRAAAGSRVARVLQHLVDRIAVQIEHPGYLTGAHAVNEVGPTNSPV